MSLTPSSMVALGSPAPDFLLPDTTNEAALTSFQDVKKSKGLLVMFICNHCPYVKHLRQGLAQLGRDYGNSDLGLVAINSNDASSYPEDGPDAMAAEAVAAGYSFPYLFDESQSVARAFDATCTPDFFLFDGLDMLVYRGQFDASRPGDSVPVTGTDVRAAMDALLAASQPEKAQKPSVGCSIKWRR